MWQRTELMKVHKAAEHTCDLLGGEMETKPSKEMIFKGTTEKGGHKAEDELC